MEDGYGGLAGARKEAILGGSGGGIGTEHFGGSGGPSDLLDKVEDLDDPREDFDLAMARASSSWVGGGGSRSSASLSSSSKGSASSDNSSIVEYTSEYAESSAEWILDDLDSGILDENDDVRETAADE